MIIGTIYKRDQGDGQVYIGKTFDQPDGEILAQHSFTYYKQALQIMDALQMYYIAKYDAVNSFRIADDKGFQRLEIQ